MKKEFKALAMRCDQDQFDRIKPKLEKAGIKTDEIWSFEICSYLTNAYRGCDCVSNIQGSYLHDFNRTVYETWNEEIFLKSCGIETEPVYTITKDQILKYDMREEFPEVFEVELQANKWYKYNNCLLCYQGIENNCIQAYGFFLDGAWCCLGNMGNNPERWTEATHEEVFKALKSEAVRRGYCKVNTFVKSIIFDGEEVNLSESGYEKTNYKLGSSGSFSYNGVTIFKKGIWAEIIKPKQMTQSEIEKELGYKIEII